MAPDLSVEGLLGKAVASGLLYATGYRFATAALSRFSRLRRESPMRCV